MLYVSCFITMTLYLISLVSLHQTGRLVFTEAPTTDGFRRYFFQVSVLKKHVLVQHPNSLRSFYCRQLRICQWVFCVSLLQFSQLIKLLFTSTAQWKDESLYKVTLLWVIWRHCPCVICSVDTWKYHHTVWRTLSLLEPVFGFIYLFLIEMKNV